MFRKHPSPWGASSLVTLTSQSFCLKIKRQDAMERLSVSFGRPLPSVFVNTRPLGTILKFRQEEKGRFGFTMKVAPHEQLTPLIFFFFLCLQKLYPKLFLDFVLACLHWVHVDGNRDSLRAGTVAFDARIQSLSSMFVRRALRGGTPRCREEGTAPALLDSIY